MRIVLDASRLRDATAVEQDHFRDLVRALLVRGSQHTFSISSWPGDSCGDCASFLSPLPRCAASWSVESERPAGEGRPPAVARTIVYCALGSPRDDPRARHPGAPVIVAGFDPTPTLARRGRGIAPDGSWVLAWTRAAEDRIVRANGASRSRVFRMPPPAGGPLPWDREEPWPARRSLPYLVTSTCGVSTRELAGIFRTFDGSLGAPDLVVLGRVPATRRIWTRFRSRGRIRFAGESSRSRRLRILGSATAYLAVRGEGRAWLPIGEAISMGVPVVAADQPDLTELLGDSAAYYPEGGVAALAADWPGGDPIRARELAQRGLDRARALSWERFARRLLDLFRGVSEAETIDPRLDLWRVVA